MARFKDDRFEAEFIVDQPREVVWESLQKSGPVEPAFLSAWPRMPGFDKTGTVTTATTSERLPSPSA